MIFIECKPDFALVHFLGIGKKRIRHSGNKSGVCKKLRRTRREKGLVDEDPHAPQLPYLKNLNEIAHQHEIKVLHDNNRDNKVIILCPRLENWILMVANNDHVDVRTYNLPNDADGLHKIINHRLDNFERLLNALRNTRQMQALQGYISDC